MANRITVVIPVYNRRDLVGRTLASLTAQTAPAFDTVLVDNASTDGSRDVLEAWAAANSTAQRPVRVLTEATPGACAARNAGLAECRTPWVLFFDSDDEMLPQHIERVFRGIADNPQADILGWNVLYLGDGVKKFDCNSALWNNVFEGNFATLRWSARTDLVRRAGGWDPAMRLWDDIELGARMLALKPAISHLGPEITVRVHPQEQSISANAGGDYLERMEAPLRSIASRLPADKRIWTDYVRMTAAGNTFRSATSGEVRRRARALAVAVAASAPSTGHRLLLWGTYHFRRLGGRGQNRILKLLLNH